MPADLSGRKVLVTGGASGIGAACAARLRRRRRHRRGGRPGRATAPRKVAGADRRHRLQRQPWADLGVRRRRTGRGRRRRHQQCRNPARVAGRGLPRGQVPPHPGADGGGAVPPGAGRPAAHVRAGPWGPASSTSRPCTACAPRPLQERLRVRQARTGRAVQGHRLGGRRQGRHLQHDLPRLRAHPVG